MATKYTNLSTGVVEPAKTGDIIKIVFTCEGCGRTLLIKSCSEFEAYDIPRMLCKGCRKKEAVS